MRRCTKKAASTLGDTAARQISALLGLVWRGVGGRRTDEELTDSATQYDREDAWGESKSKTQLLRPVSRAL